MSTPYEHPTTIVSFESVYNTEYRAALAYCDSMIQRCEQSDDFYGVNFHQGMRAAHIFNDIKMCQLIRVLKQEYPNNACTAAPSS